MEPIKVEICCGSADDVFEAAAAGADRVELNAAMFLGGLTPTLGEVLVAREAGIPIMAMVRPREGGFCYTEREFAGMVKGQAFITAAYTLGCAAGNFAGGQLLQYFGVRTMLASGVGMALAGAAILFLTVNRRDN